MGRLLSKQGFFGMNNWRVIGSRVIHKTPWIEVVEDECETGDHKFLYTYVRRVDEGPLIIPESDYERLWLVRQYRHPIRRFLWQFPCEGMHYDEKWSEAAKRGLREELGVEARELIDLGMVFPDPGGLQQKAHFFLARGLTDCEGEMVTSGESTEEIEKGLFTLHEIDKLIDGGEICDGWTLAGLYLYRRYLEKK